MGWSKVTALCSRSGITGVDHEFSNGSLKAAAVTTGRCSHHRGIQGKVWGACCVLWCLWHRAPGIYWRENALFKMSARPLSSQYVLNTQLTLPLGNANAEMGSHVAALTGKPSQTTRNFQPCWNLCFTMRATL